MASIETGNADRDAHLRAVPTSSTPSASEIRYASTRIEHVEGGTYRVTGEPTIKDIDA